VAIRSIPVLENMIQVEELSKTFRGVVAVDDISFQVQRSQIFAFLGQNGAGKSTTLKMLTMLLQPTSGRIVVNGYDPSRQANLVRRSMGVVFQEHSLDEHLSPYENLELHGALYGMTRADGRERIQKTLTLVDMWDRRHGKLAEFSSGMKRRVEIARSLLHRPQALILDEPTVGLDARTRNSIWQFLQLLNRTEGVTVFFTTHYLEEAERYAQKVVIIDQGKIVAGDTPAELKRQTGSVSLEESFLSLTVARRSDGKGMAR
jgi:ABC-2 type transport system ATP-binding protein